MILNVVVKPSARTTALSIESDGLLRIQLRSAPINGDANAELVKFLAKHYHVPQSSVHILRGLRGKNKRIEIIGVQG